MNGLASFDRWLTQRKPASRPAVRPEVAPAPPAPRLYLIDPQHRGVAPLTEPPGAEALLRWVHGASPADWLGLLAEDGQTKTLQPAWRLALWRQGAAAPEWLGPPLPARAGECPRALRAAALRTAEHAVWASGWRLVTAVPDQALRCS